MPSSSVPTRSTGNPAVAGATIRVEVCRALPLRCISRSYELAPPATVRDVLALAAADPAFDGIDLSAVGIFGRIADAAEPVAEGDRVEIYRPLAADPKNARRARVREARRRR
jgi:putative ubiquitin-RnfH superfamily antitoxin RatB of RatAB toxin-antitoxin module